MMVVAVGSVVCDSFGQCKLASWEMGRGFAHPNIKYNASGLCSPSRWMMAIVSTMSSSSLDAAAMVTYTSIPWSLGASPSKRTLLALNHLKLEVRRQVWARRRKRSRGLEKFMSRPRNVVGRSGCLSIS